MVNQKFVEVLEKLHRLTKEGVREWEVTTMEDVFQVSYPDYSIQVFSRPARLPEDSDSLDYVIQIYDFQGQLMDEMDDIELREYYLAHRSGKNALTLMRELYEAARRSALNVDEVYDKLLDHLASDESPF